MTSYYKDTGETDEWYTPAYIFQALGIWFDIDVACPVEGPRHVPCTSWLSSADVNPEWFGTIWMNPPFGNQSNKRAWLDKFFKHGDGIALVPDRTSAQWFQECGARADAICFVAPKIKFERPDGSRGESPGNGTALLSLGPIATPALMRCGLGIIVVPRR